MGQTFSLGRIRGIQIGVNWSVLLIVALLAYGLAALLGWFLISAATAENQQAAVQSELRTVTVRQIMTADPATVPASTTVAQFFNDFLPWHRHSAFPVVADGQTVGLVTVHRASQVPAGQRGETTVRDAGRVGHVRRGTDSLVWRSLAGVSVWSLFA